MFDLFNLLLPEHCDCLLCTVVSLNPLWPLSEMIGDC